jgi:hypothetical protein
MNRAQPQLDSLACPHCGESFPITTAIQQQLIAPLRIELETEAAGKAVALTIREAELQEKESALAAAREKIEDEVTKRVAKHRVTLAETLRKEARESVAVDLEDLQRQVREKTEKITELQQTELSLRERERQLEDHKKSLELEVARKVDVERHKIEAMVSARVAEEYQSGDSSELASRLPCKGKSVRNRGVSQTMPFLVIPRSKLRGGFILERKNMPSRSRICGSKSVS